MPSAPTPALAFEGSKTPRKSVCPTNPKRLSSIQGIQHKDYYVAAVIGVGGEESSFLQQGVEMKAKWELESALICQKGQVLDSQARSFILGQ